MKEAVKESFLLSRLTALPLLQGHAAYVGSLAAVADCMSRLAGQKGAAIGVSMKRMKNMLAAIAVHLRDAGSWTCCQNASGGDAQRFEGAFLNAYAAYRNSAHANSCSSLTLISVHVQPEDRVDPEGELLLLPACLDLLRAKLGIPADRAA